ncbi:hypothetical protein [Streptomyces sp. NPDC058486]|uniref:allophanate hydrolase-related protein n=1 Tax=unclassified Streptomyces TaxID=2593676 RepID=UPI00364C1F1D
MTPEGLGALVAALPRPMADGTSEVGFLCEPEALKGAPDITAYGGWRAALAAGLTPPPGV